MTDSAPTEYLVDCYNCQAPFDALGASWCSCLVTSRTLMCPACLKCFCAAPPAYQQRFWRGAPRLLWDRKFEEHNAAADTEWKNPDPAEARRPLVLLVDDERDIRRVATRIITSLDYGLVVGTNGGEGLDLARRYKPDLVLSDALMPQVDGRELCLRLKQDPETQHIKVVVMTSLYTAAKYRNQAFTAYHVDDYLNKPLELNALRDVLQKHLGQGPQA
jgi:CheY-like chemotaxis protein